MTRVVLNQKALNDLLQSDGSGIARDLMRRANNVENQAKRLCPVDQGRLRASIRRELATDSGELVARVGTNVEYAMFVHEGTGLYGPRGRYIVPVRKKVLRWAQVNNSGRGRRRYRGGRTESFVYSKRSSGFRGRPFLRDALPAANN